MWGICLDVDVLNGLLFQTVVEYNIVDNNAELISPFDDVVISMSKIKEIPNIPCFSYGEIVSPINHLDIKGQIHIIKWHFDLKECYYKIQVNGNLKSRRYFAEDLVEIKQ